MVLFYIDIVITSIFTLEAIIKLIAHGVIVGEKAYFRNNWNILDCLIVLISVSYKRFICFRYYH